MTYHPRAMAIPASSEPEAREAVVKHTDWTLCALCQQSKDDHEVLRDPSKCSYESLANTLISLDDLWFTTILQQHFLLR